MEKHVTLISHWSLKEYSSEEVGYILLTQLQYFITLHSQAYLVRHLQLVLLAMAGLNDLKATLLREEAGTARCSIGGLCVCVCVCVCVTISISHLCVCDNIHIPSLQGQQWWHAQRFHKQSGCLTAHGSQKNTALQDTGWSQLTVVSGWQGWWRRRVYEGSCISLATQDIPSITSCIFFSQTSLKSFNPTTTD